MLIRGSFLYAPSLEKLEIREDAYLLVEDGKAQQFYDDIPETLQSETVVDYSGSIIIPAFNDLHIHAPQMINRGVGFDKELLPWLETYTFPVEGRYCDPDFAARAYAVFLRKVWAGGTMRFSAFGTIHKESTWKLMEMTEASGMCALIGKVNMDRNAPDYLCEDTDRSLADTEELALRCREELSNVGYIITPRFVPSTTAKLMRGLGDLTEKYDLPVQSHLSENLSEIAWVSELHPECSSYTDVYDHYGLMPSDRTIMAHCIHLCEEEKDVLQRKNVMLTHCAQSNMDLSSGIMPIRRNLERGLRCCIASDVAGSHTSAMNRHLVACIELSKVNQMSRKEERNLSLAEALFLATKQSGSFFGKVGSFEPGYDFDALVIDTRELGAEFPRTPFEQLELFVYDGDDRDIKVRYCRGRVVGCPV